MSPQMETGPRVALTRPPQCPLLSPWGWRGHPSPCSPLSCLPHEPLLPPAHVSFVVSIAGNVGSQRALYLALALGRKRHECAILFSDPAVCTPQGSGRVMQSWGAGRGEHSPQGAAAETSAERRKHVSWALAEAPGACDTRDHGGWHGLCSPSLRKAAHLTRSSCSPSRGRWWWWWWWFSLSVNTGGVGGPWSH